MNTQLSVFKFSKKLGNSISRVEPVEPQIEGLRLSNYEFQRIQDALAPIKNEDGSIKAINARDLHAWLEIGRDFPTWIKDQIERADLAEKLDFEVFPNSGENGSPQKGSGRPRIEYHLSPDAAKEIAMMTNSSKSKILRGYFLDCEKRLHGNKPAPTPMTYIEALEAHLKAEKERERLAIENQRLAIENQQQENSIHSISHTLAFQGRNGMWDLKKVADQLVCQITIDGELYDLAPSNQNVNACLRFHGYLTRSGEVSQLGKKKFGDMIQIHKTEFRPNQEHPKPLFDPQSPHFGEFLQMVREWCVANKKNLKKVKFKTAKFEF